MQTETKEGGQGEASEGAGEASGDDGDKTTKQPAESKHWSQNKLKTSYRKFNLDLAPKVSYNNSL